MRELAHEMAGELASWDGKVLATARLLVLSPGRLTREYLAGRRTRYLSPLRAYLTASVIFFTLMTVLPDPPAPRAQVSASLSRPNLSDAEANVRGPELSRKLQRGMRRAVREPALFDSQLNARIPAIGFLLCPAFALLLAVAYRRTRRFYPEHLAFALHAHAFAFLVLAGAMTVRLTGWRAVGDGAKFVALAATALWLFVGMREVYGGSRLRTALTLAGIALGYAAAFGIGLIAVIGYSYIVFSPT
jgi:hypothetical protein